jgi:outer membrane receptor protein involved in Fe transport
VLFNAYSSRESYLGVVPTLAGGAGNDHLLDGYLVNYRFAVDITQRVDFQLGLTLDYNHRDLSRVGDDSERSDVTGHRVMGVARAGLDLAKWLVLDLSLDADYRVGQSYSNYDAVTGETLADNSMANRDVWELSAVLMARLMLEPLLADVPLTLQAGLRYTKNQLFEDNVAFRGTLVYRLTPTQSLKLVAGQSFRAPTLFELYFATGTGTVFGATTLQPEGSLSVELAYLLGYERFFAQVLGYYANYDNKIFRVRRAAADPNDTSLIYVNGDPFSAFGLEAELMLRDADLFDAFVNYSFVSGDDGDDTGQDHYNFKYVPQHTLSAGLGKRYRGFFCSTVVNWIGERGSPGGGLAGQVTWDLTAGYRGALGTHTITAKNLLDEDVRVPAYVRRNLDSLSSGYGRTVMYRFKAEL